MTFKETMKDREYDGTVWEDKNMALNVLQNSPKLFV